MTYGALLTDTLQSSTAGTPPVFKDGGSTEVGQLCRAWVQFVGSTAVRNGNFNVSSITRNATGNYTLTFTNAMPDTNYSVVLSCNNGGVYAINVSSLLAASATVIVYNSGGTPFDSTIITAAVFR